MVSGPLIRGWNIFHQEKLFFQVHSGLPQLMIKFFQYPEYHQTVQMEKYPEQCTLKTNKQNSSFIFNHRVGKKGVISLERTVIVYPERVYCNPEENWGNISDVSQTIQKKYQQASKYWPINSDVLKDIYKEDWFETDNLSSWVVSASNYINTIIKHRENMDVRLGAVGAFVKGTGDCDEFTDLFITFARMRGIPCRRLTGFFIKRKEKKFVGEPHAWCDINSSKKGWIPVDVALNNLGKHTLNYVILKIEEFNPALPDYKIITKGSGTVHYNWDRPDPLIIPVI